MSTSRNNSGSQSHEEEVKRAADLREWLEGRIGELESELSKLKDMLMVVDSFLRKSSFVPATELRTKTEQTKVPDPETASSLGISSKKITRSNSAQEKSTKVAAVATESPSSAPSVESSEQTRQLRRSKDGMILANALVGAEKVEVVPAPDVKLSQTTPPFQSFFVNRILKGFESKDVELIQSGKLESSQGLKFAVEEAEGHITKVTVDNYRDKSRLNEILNTISWAFSRMLEKK